MSLRLLNQHCSMLASSALNARIVPSCSYTPLVKGVPCLGPRISRTNRRSVAVVRAQGQTTEEVDQGSLTDYCAIDPKTGRRLMSKKTLGEKEQEFLGALQNFYYADSPLMSNEEFDNLKDDLLWSGSKVAILSVEEQKFLEAVQSYQAGRPILNDKEFDDLKKQLRKENSFVVQQGPRCSIRSKKMYADATPDYAKLVLLNVPAVLVTLLVLFSIDDITGFEITKVMELPEPYGIIAVWGLVLPTVFVVANAITNIAFPNALILKGSCPNCGTENVSYFGDIFTVPGNRDSTTTKCSNCEATLEFQAEDRQLVVTDLSTVKPEFQT